MSATDLVTRAGHTLEDAIPTTCRIDDVCRILNMSRKTFERLMTRKQLALVEITRLGRIRRFTGESVAAVRRSRWSPDANRRPA